MFRVESQDVEQEVGKKAAKQKEVQLKEIPLGAMRELTVRIYKGEELLFHTDGFNEALLSGITLFKKEGEDGYHFMRDYRFEAKFNLEEWPEAAYPNDQTSDIHWDLKIFATDNILIIEDSREKEFFEKIINNWEETEPGRSEKAKRSRERYLLLRKQEIGEELTEEEVDFLAEF